MEAGDFEWQKRHRVQVSLRSIGSDSKRGRILRHCALNEVFVGERDPCRASVLKVSCDGGKWDRHKCSGLIVATGTGSSAWIKEASTVTPQDCVDVLRGLVSLHGDDAVSRDIHKILTSPDGLDAGAVASETNMRLAEDRLAPEDHRLQMLVREPILPSGDISAGSCIWKGFDALHADIEEVESGHHPSRRSLVRRLVVSSVGSDAQLVLDGRVWVPLERGMEAVLET
eukprot:CAMPEP_0114121932 /NCGR_PEP_ID=MMETSP0043_2-20121206/7431_1 /TAXON_ID=464988 /ORGANISM="Hemiselmis andersenii, Strain CCMP644" /LENGTH=227 /DNA_ID=CAMNT_0001214625 /DNA_START=159 /DNA_END=838 /DNA_ORIENTATION=-